MAGAGRALLGSITLACGITAMAHGAGMPEWVQGMSVEDAAKEFPAANTIQLLAYHECRVDEEGVSRHLVREAFFVRAGDGKGCTTIRFVESSWRDLIEMCVWRRDPGGRVERYDKPIVSQVNGGALYAEDQEYTILVPSIEPGSLIARELRYESKYPSFGTEVAFLRCDIPVRIWEHHLILPGGVVPEAYWLEPGRDLLEPAVASSEIGGVHVWLRENAPDLGDREPYQPDDGWLAPRLLVRWTHEPGGPLNRWDDVVAWYHPISESAFEGMQSLSDVCARIQSSIPDTSGRAAPVAQLPRAVAEFVRANIGYVQIYLDDGGIRPHRVSDVYQSRFGDCKDMSHLMVGMLRRLGVASYPVLTDSGREPSIRPGFPTSSFDHCIVAIEDADADGGFQYFDPTAKNIPFGRLPYQLLGSPALVIEPGRAGDLVRLPVEDASNNGGVSRARVTLSTGLLARGEITEILFGHPAFELRSWLQAQTPAERLRWVQDRFEEGSSRAVITDLVFSDLEAVEETLWIGYVLQLPGAARRVGDKTIWHPDVFPREGKRAFGEKARRRPIEYKYPMRWERIVEAQVPEGWFADDLPAPISVRNALGRYESKIMVDESLVRFESTQSIDSVFVPVQEYSLVQELDQARYDAQRRGILFGTP